MITKKIGIFKRFEIETQSTCNRTCVTCIRNSNPDKQQTAAWFEKNQLPFDDIKRILDEAISMGFRGEICLSHYNEPLMDERFVDIAKYVKGLGVFSRVFCCSNADFLTEEIAAGLDGVLDDIGFSLYMDDPVRTRRAEWIRSLFKKTKLLAGSTGFGFGDHMVTHYSPDNNLITLISNHKNKPCHLPKVRMIVNHRGEQLLCCDDMVGNFALGSIYENTIEELWYSEKHQNYVLTLEKNGGRSIHHHCLSCPRP